MTDMLRRYRLICAAVVALALLPTMLHADPPDYDDDHILVPRPRPATLIGPFAGANYNQHTGQFVTTENGLTCCEFKDGDGVGEVFGAKAFIPFGWYFRLSPRLGIEARGGDFNALPQYHPIFGANDTIEMAEFTNTLTVTIRTFTVDLFATVQLPSIGLYVAGGPSFAFVVSTNFIKTESITGPEDVTYLEGVDAKILYEGDLGIVNSPLISLRGGIGATVKILPWLYVNPEVLYGYPLNLVSDQGNNEWKSNTFQGTFALLFAL